MAVSRVQATGSNVGGSAVSYAFPGAVTAGDLLVLFWAGHETTVGSASVSDNVNGTWSSGTSLTGIPSSGKDLNCFWVLSSGAAAAGALTITFAGLTTGSQFSQAVEYSWGGTSGTLDSGFSASAVGTATSSSVTSGTPSSSGELWLCGAVTSTEGAGTFTVVTPFTGFALDGSGLSGGGASGTFTIVIEEDLSGGASAVTAQVNLGVANNYGTTVIGFVPPAAGTDSGPNYAGAAASLAGGTGTWVNTANADGAPDGATADWTAP